MLLAQTPTGTIAGQVLDSQTGRPIPAASVLLNGQQAGGQKSDTDGRFTLIVSPGKYTLTYQAENYSEVKVEEVIVAAGETTEASTVMANKSVVTTVEVNEKADSIGATAEAMLSERKLSASVSDSIGKEELANSSASNAAGALEKVTEGCYPRAREEDSPAEDIPGCEAGWPDRTKPLVGQDARQQEA